MIVVDTGVLYSFYVANDPNHGRAVELFREAEQDLVVSPYVMAELDYFLVTRIGVPAELAVIEDLCAGGFELPAITSADVLTCQRILAARADHQIGLTDASLVVLAERYNTRKIATFDHRHFTILRTLDGAPFELLP